MSGNIYNSLDRVRKPRVHISLDIEKGDAQPIPELAFVVGVMGDFSGDPQTRDAKGVHPAPLQPLGDRKFVQINRDNFNQVMANMTPGLNLEVKNTLSQDSNAMTKVSLAFSSIDDFDPAKVAGQVPALKALLDARNRLRELLVQADRSAELESLLETVLQDPKRLNDIVAGLKTDKAD
nr:type VI secretion system contractile sheath small subunit [uncultured Rhodopila sp.]